MTRRSTGERRWPWYQQISDAAFAAVGLGIAVSMVYRERYPILGIVTMVACAGKITASQLLRLLLGRWESKP